uniref:E3 ubiquitin-protein ligase UPL5-like n=1 Tax=Erigeron canadensis TaxID=72917 RepID=UPI001CB946A4|nr:E3 ubiquitin-protein ligase UPL5-like [Erigeron canadensis]
MKRKLGVESEEAMRDGMIQLFVRTFSASSSSNYNNNSCYYNKHSSRSLVVFGKPDDTIESIQVKIEAATGIPVSFQRLMYAGKQLGSEHTLRQSNITNNDSSLHLVARTGARTHHPHAARLVNDLLSFVYRLRSSTSNSNRRHIDNLLDLLDSKLKEFSYNAFSSYIYHASVYVNIFRSYGAPEALVLLYMSPPHKRSALHSLQSFIISVSNRFYPVFTPLLLHFSKLLFSSVAHDDPFYLFCRTRLGYMLTSVSISSSPPRPYSDDEYKQVDVISAHDLLPFVYQIATNLSPSSMNFDRDFNDFTNFVTPIKKLILLRQVPPVQTPIHSLPMHYYTNFHPNPHPFYIRDFLFTIFLVLFSEMKACLNKVEEHIKAGKRQVDMNNIGWDHCLSFLTQVYHIAKMYQGAEETFITDMRLNYKVSLCYLIVRYAKRGVDYNWILQRKDLTDFQSRRHLVMLLLPELKNDYYDNVHEMLIDRSQLLAESFNYILAAKTDALRGGLFMEFKNEEATGPGVLREWFLLVCQSIFDPHKALFIPCPNDRRRFFPNPASKVDPMHLDYYQFAGRVIALALMHKMQVGIVFDRTFFLQLAGVDISLDDVKDADPYLYSSCKQILDMDPCAVDEDTLGLSFVWEFEELGSMKLLELLPNGKHIPVNSRNRKEYIHLLIRHRFVTSVTQQVTRFAQGFTDIVTKDETRKLIFKSLEVRDLDGMLYGSGSDISVDDWKAHTEYMGYKVTDRQIKWFWKIVGEMTAEQRKVLLFFWTSVKYLPVEGFRGLASKLYICRSIEKVNRLPSSHTCFYQICFPAYPSKAVMQRCLNTIAQEHIGCSFGTC